MNYPFENLDPEKFQEFCQALLTKEFSGVQCFPVAQPDGGRDALSYGPLFEGSRGAGFLMFQIKFVRNPYAEFDPHQWLIDILKKEVPILIMTGGVDLRIVRRWKTLAKRKQGGEHADRAKSFRSGTSGGPQ